MPPNHFESEVESFLEGSHGDRTHIKRADHHTVTPLCGTLLIRAFDVARKLTNERQRQELLFASYGELARGYVSSLSSKSKPPAGSFPVRVILIGPAAGCRTLSLATPGTMTVPDENTSLP